MSTLYSKKSRNNSKLKINKSLGAILVEDRKRYHQLKEKKSKTFNEVLENLNKTLRRTQSLLQVNHYPKKNDINNYLPKEKINYIKKYNYYRRWHFNNNVLPIVENSKNNNQYNVNNKENNDNNKKVIKTNFYNLGSLYRAKKNADIRKNKVNNRKTIEEENIPFYFKGLQPKKNNVKASEIVKISIQEMNKKNAFKRYRYNLEEKVGNFVDYNDKFTNYYDYDKKVKLNIKDEKIGISIPGNILNRNSLGYIRTLQPKNINTKIKKSISVPEKTLLPVPVGLGGRGLNYTHITLKEVYNEKNKLI